ncbi:MAG: peptidylprolyl isomerase [Candidatus Rokubacteria bacterium]|nr:peptidylprolyl isomerase [Candidatus Rokubacteria bacterium]
MRIINRLAPLFGLAVAWSVTALLLAATSVTAHDERQPLKMPSDLDVRVLARVNGTFITGEDFHAAFDSIPVESQLPARANPRVFLRTLIRRELLYQAAVRAGLDKDPAIIRKLDRLKREFLTTEMANRERQKATTEITDEAIRGYYDANPQLFASPERASASHILLKASEEAETILARLKDGADFAGLAREHSQDARTRELGGRIFRIVRGQMTPEFERAVFGLRTGEISGVVEDKDGYHIILLHEHVAASVIPFEAAREKLRPRVAFERGQERLKALLADLERQGTVELFDEALEGIK